MLCNCPNFSGSTFPATTISEPPKIVMETVLSDVCDWRLGIVKLNIPEQVIWDLVVEFLQFIKKKRKKETEKSLFSHHITNLKHFSLRFFKCLVCFQDLCGKLWKILIVITGSEIEMTRACEEDYSWFKSPALFLSVMTSVKSSRTLIIK